MTEHERNQWEDWFCKKMEMLLDRKLKPVNDGMLKLNQHIFGPSDVGNAEDNPGCFYQQIRLKKRVGFLEKYGWMLIGAWSLFLLGVEIYFNIH